jgi:hypothetical protein
MQFNASRVLPLMLAMALAGCGTAGNQLRPAVSERSLALAAAAASTTEAVPTETELRELEAKSPDRLIENAPPEPGVKGIFPSPPKDDLGNFGKVNDTLFRGARPTDRGLEQLKAMGVRTIVNFENDKKVVEHERQWCESHGIKFYSIALSVVTPPKQAKIDEWLRYAEDDGNRPLYFHCMQGRDRTGTAALTYRMHHDKWKFDQAYAEMKSYKFHTYLLGLQFYIRNYKP